MIKEWTSLGWGGLISHYRPRNILQGNVLLSIWKSFIIINATESTNSQGHYHMFCDGATNCPKKGLLTHRLGAFLGLVSGPFISLFRTSPILSHIWSIPTTCSKRWPHIERRKRTLCSQDSLKGNGRRSPETNLVLRFLAEPTTTNYFQKFDPLKRCCMLRVK